MCYHGSKSYSATDLNEYYSLIELIVQMNDKSVKK
jgi:hypothetical protein